MCGWLRSRAEVEDDEDSDDSDDEAAVAGLAGGASPVVEAGVLRGSGSDGRVRATGSGGGGVCSPLCLLCVNTLATDKPRSAKR